MSRVMAKIVKIDSISPIKDADAIEVARVGGWNVVIKKGEYNTGDLVVYCEIDSWIPHDIAPFLSKGQEPKEYDGVKGNRLRTVKLRGVLSQGLILHRTVALDKVGEIHEGMDVSKLLGIQKYEPPIPAQLQGQMKGPFPTYIPKTDQARVQNLVEEVKVHKHELFEVTIKLDGTSCTIYHKDENFGICSRNWEMKISDENKDNTYVRIFNVSNIESALKAIGRNVAIQGEIMGPGIQSNREKLKDPTLFVFDIYDIDKSQYMSALERLNFIDALYAHNCSRTVVQHVPVLCHRTLEEFSSIDDILTFAEGPSEPNTKIEREGLVFKSMHSEFTFKAISNKFLIKED